MWDLLEKEGSNSTFQEQIHSS